MRLEKLLHVKLSFSKDIHYQIKGFHELIKKELASKTINVKLFGERFSIEKDSLYAVLFR